MNVILKKNRDSRKILVASKITVYFVHEPVIWGEGVLNTGCKKSAVDWRDFNVETPASAPLVANKLI